MAFQKKPMKRHGKPRILVTNRLASYKAAMKEINCPQKQEIGRWQNNRAENSHLPFRRRERAMQRFRRMRSLQKFVSLHSSVYNHFNNERHSNSRDQFKNQRSAALKEWQHLYTALSPHISSKMRRVRVCLTAPPYIIELSVFFIQYSD